MEKTKAIVLIIAASVLLVAFAGIAYSQIVSAQTAGTGNVSTQTRQSTTKGNSYQNPQQGYSPYGPQYEDPYGYRLGMGMCRHFY